MKRLGLSILIVLLFIGQMTFAQRKHRAPEKNLEQLKTELNLTDEQVAQIKKIGADAKEKMMELKQQEGNRASKKAGFKKIKEEKMAAFEQILTEEQRQLWETKKAEVKAKRRAHRAEMKAARKKITPKQRKAIRTETQQYVVKNVLPVLQKQRAKLEQQMVAADRNKVEELRGVLKAKKAEMKKKRAAMKKERKAMKEKGQKLTEEERKAKKAEKQQQRMEHKAKYKEHLEMAKTLATKYESNIQTLQGEIATDIEQWKKDISAIAAKHGVDVEKMKSHVEQPTKDKTKKRAKKGRKGKKRRGKQGGLQGSFTKYFTKVGFLLLDPNEDYAALIEEWENMVTEINEKPNETASIQNIKIYPNPASASNTLAYEVLEAGKVTVELRSKEGALVKTVVNENKAVGEYSLQVNLSDLSNNVYYYVIRNKEGQMTKKFVVQK